MALARMVALRCAVERGQLGACVAQIRLRHDRVAPVDTLRLVARELHGHRARDTGALKGPDGAPPEIMEEQPGETRPLTGLPPRTAERLDSAATPVEDKRDDSRLGAFTPSRQLLPVLKKRAEDRRDRKGSPFLVLRRSRLESDEASVPIHLGPRQREHFSATPSGYEREADAIRHIQLESLADRVDLFG